MGGGGTRGRDRPGE
jgi:hypothetical protein